MSSNSVNFSENLQFINYYATINPYNTQGCFGLYYSKGAIIGEAELVNCILVDEDFSNELIKINPVVYGKNNHDITYAWELVNVKKYDNPIFIKGKLGLWNYDGE